VPTRLLSYPLLILGAEDLEEGRIKKAFAEIEYYMAQLVPELGSMEEDNLKDGVVSRAKITDVQAQEIYSVAIQDPGNGQNIGLFRAPADLTITKVAAVLLGSGGPSIDYQISFSADRSDGSPTDVFSGAETVTSETTGDEGTIDDGAVSEDDWLWVVFSNKSGTVDEITITLVFDKD